MQWRNFRLTPLEMLIAVLAILGIIYLVSTWNQRGDSYPAQNAAMQESGALWQQALAANENSIQQFQLLQEEVAKLRDELAKQNQRLIHLEQRQETVAGGNAANSVSFPTPTARPGYHTVKANDTLQSLAGQYQLAVADLAAWNNLKPGAMLRVGQRLRLNSGN